MKIFLDTADVDEIRKAHETGLINGVTTNPTLIKKSGRDPVEVIKEISASFSSLQSISAEVVADTAEEMVDQAQAFNGLWNVTIKVPCTVEGLKACTALAMNQYKVNVTLIFSVAQAILAEKAGATYVSPFVGRWFDNSVDGIELIKNIRQAYTGGGHFTTTEILSASLRDVRQVEQCALAGTDVVTIPSKVFWGMYKNVLTDKGLEQFQKDWDSVQSL
jgi:transaldolase|tara:strand:- start:409 stop:1065 length:657 start_codon:yes stop_codon:yes gene_type:complete